MDFIKQLADNGFIDGEKFVITKNFLDSIESIKNQYHFDVLKNISANSRDGKLELVYSLYSAEDDEDFLVSVVIESKAESVKHLFINAEQYENAISEEYQIEF